jgi:DNA-3-methyladenine glycosylase II
MPASASHEGRSIAFRPAPPVDVAGTLERHHLWGEDPANRLVDGALHRVLRVEGRLVPVRLESRGSVRAPRVRVTAGVPPTAAVRHAVRTAARALLGLDADLAGFYRLAARDPVLAPLVRRLWGLRPSRVPDPFETLVGAICAQQVNLTFAYATRARLVRRYGEPAGLDGVEVHAFPSPQRLAAAAPAELRGLQFSARKAEYVVGLARAATGGGIDLAGLAGAPDAAVVAALTALRGLGRWTAEWFLARGLGRPDVCPAGDLGVRRAVEAFCFGGRPASEEEVRRRAEAWRPHRTLAVHYLLAGHRLARAEARAAAGARA